MKEIDKPYYDALDNLVEEGQACCLKHLNEALKFYNLISILTTEHDLQDSAPFGVLLFLINYNENQGINLKEDIWKQYEDMQVIYQKLKGFRVKPRITSTMH